MERENCIVLRSNSVIMNTKDEFHNFDDSSVCSNASQEDYQSSQENDNSSASQENQEVGKIGWSRAGDNVASASAFAAIKRRKKLHQFEVNPALRNRQHNRLLRKLKQTVDEFSMRVGQQAIILVVNPGKDSGNFRCFGARPLEDVVKNLKDVIVENLESALVHQAPPPAADDPSLFELPQILMDGIPTPVEKMTQAQLRAFIPLMLKYSTGRGKPGWGRDMTKPPWWPENLPWANVRMDARTEEQKKKVPWTKALRQIVINCYKYHGREDLLPALTDEDILRMMDDEDEDEDEEGVDDVSSQNRDQQQDHQYKTSPEISQQDAPVEERYSSTVIQAIQNSDGTVSVIQIDPSNPLLTLHDGTTAHVQSIATIHSSHHGSNEVEMTDMTVSTAESVNDDPSMDILNNLTEATINQDGQIILTSEDGQGYPVSVSNVITVPGSPSVYQTVVANIQQIAEDGSIQLTPVVRIPKLTPDCITDDRSDEDESLDMGHHHHHHQQMITVASSADTPHILQVISVKDAATVKALLAQHQKCEDVHLISSD